MNRDAKIGIVVVLIVVGLLVIILVQGDPDRGEAEISMEDATTPPAESLEPDLDFLDRSFEEDFGQLTRDWDETRPERPDRTRTEEPEEPETRRTPDRTPADEPEEERETEPDRERESERTVATRESTDASQDDIWEYTVKSGDTISEISQRELGTARRWREIAALNDLSEPYSIHADQKLKMPPRGESVSVDEPTRTTTDRTATEREMVGRERYVVRPNDIKDIMEIARRQLGDWKEWRTIAELSGLAPPFEISTGDVLWLPVYE